VLCINIIVYMYVGVHAVKVYMGEWRYGATLKNNVHIIYIYRVSHKLRSLLRESVTYVKIYRYNPKHLYPKLNGYRDNGQRSLKV